MNLDATGAGALTVVLVMALVTLATRWGGVFVMAFVPISDRVRQFITAMSGSVLVAIVAPMALQGDAGSAIGAASHGSDHAGAEKAAAGDCRRYPRRGAGQAALNSSGQSRPLRTPSSAASIAVITVCTSSASALC